MHRDFVFNIFHTLYFFSYKLIYRKVYKKNLDLRRRRASLNETSLIGFDELSTIFIHIPKTAGISLNQALFTNLGGSHRSVKNYMQIFSNKEFRQYYKFCFVRNPWDRLASSYFFLKNGGINELDKEWAKKNLSNCESFQDFVLNYLETDAILSYVHFIPQYKFITCLNKVRLDRVYKLEEIGNAIEDVQNRLKIDLNVEHRNRSKKRKGYREYYNERTRDIVAKIYKKDILLFNYKF